MKNFLNHGEGKWKVEGKWKEVERAITEHPIKLFLKKKSALMRVKGEEKES